MGDAIAERDSTEDKQSINGIYPRGVALSIFLFVGSAAHSPAQSPRSAPPPPAKGAPAAPAPPYSRRPAPPPPAKGEPTALVDPLGRETPRGAVMGLLKSLENQD